MISAKATLVRLGIHDTSVTGAVRDVGMLIREASSPLHQANHLIETITGQPASYGDIDLAICVAQHCAETAVRNDTFDPVQALIDGVTRDTQLRNKQPWLYTKPEATSTSTEGVAIIEGSDVKVEIKSDGRIKKGGKQLMAAELYRIHVLEAATPVDNQGFIKILMKEAGLTRGGATTYAYDCKKKYGTKAA
jgi:hypothetical protein